MEDSINGFYKVNEDNGGVCVATFYNPQTKENFTKIVWDIDDTRLDRDEENAKWRFLPINMEVRAEYLHSLGCILIGDTVEVFKGRKVPIGTVGRVEAKRRIKDRYGRVHGMYVVLDNGMRTNEENVHLI